MVGQAIILGLIVLVANIDWGIGKTNISRPIIICVMVGIVMGDIRMGIIMGATLELAFIGAVAIGAAIPLETIVGSVLATAFSIAGGYGPEVALVLAVPISSLALFVRLLNLAVTSTLCLHQADKFAEKGNIRGVEAMHLIAGIFKAFCSAVVTIVAYLAGSPAIEALLNAIPASVHSGLSIAMGIMPAIGLAMLAKLLFSKNVVVFFFLGFLIVAYLDISITGMALFGFIIAVIMILVSRKNSGPAFAKNDGGNKDDDF